MMIAAGAPGGTPGPVAFLVLGGIALLVAFVNLVFPRTALRGARWRYRHSEETNVALVRASGTVALVIGVIFVVVGATR